MNVGIDSVALRAFIVDLMGELPRFGDAEPAATAALTEIAEESEKEKPEAGRVAGALARLGDIARQVGVPLLTAYVRGRIEKLGILPPAGE